jgi:hypothetical protein
VATESVKILIEAEDKATTKLKQAVSEQEKAAARAELSRVKAQKSLAAERVELEQGAEAAHAFRLELDGMEAAEAALIAREKELLTQQKKRAAEQQKLAETSGAQQTKTGAEFFGAIAGMAGGSEIASIAGQIGGLTEKTSQFGEVAKMGGANAMLFKTGLVAAAGAIGFQVGSALGNVIFQTEKFNTELEKSVANLNKLEQVQLNQLRERLSEFKIDLEFAPDQEAAVNDQIEQLKAELVGYENGAKSARSAVAALQEQGSLGVGDAFQSSTGQLITLGQYLETYTGDYQALLAEKQRELEQDQTKAELMREQIKELENIIGREKERNEIRAQREEEKRSAEFLQGLRDELESIQAEIDGKSNELRARRGAGGTFEDDEALRLIEATNAAKKQLEEQQKAERQKEQDAEKEKQRIKSIEDLKQKELDKLEEEAVLLTKGKEAAHALRLEKQGIAKEDAERIAAAQAEIDKLKQLESAKSERPQNLQAVESRLLTRGASTEDPAKKTEQHAKKTAEAVERHTKLLADIATGVNKTPSTVTLKTVS